MFFILYTYAVIKLNGNNLIIYLAEHTYKDPLQKIMPSLHL